MTSQRSRYVVVIASVAATLLGAALIDQGSALQCHFCIGIDHCNVTANGIEPVSCTDEIVRKTNESLSSFLPTLVYGRKEDDDAFQCVHMRATSLNDITFLFIRGCVYSTNSTNFCDLRYASFRGTRECVACNDEDLCNDVPISDANRQPTPGFVVVSLVTLSAALRAVVNHYLCR